MPLTVLYVASDTRVYIRHRVAFWVMPKPIPNSAAPARTIVAPRSARTIMPAMETSSPGSTSRPGPMPVAVAAHQHANEGDGGGLEQQRIGAGRCRPSRRWMWMNRARNLRQRRMRVMRSREPSVGKRWRLRGATE